MKLPCILIPLAFLVMTECAHAQAHLTFTGGVGGGISLTLDAPVTYTITTPGGSAPYFVFAGVGNYFTTPMNSTGNITFTINNGQPQILTVFYTNVAKGSETVNDLLLQGTMPGFALGDVVTLNAGKLSAFTTYTGAVPPSGNFPSFITNIDGVRVSTVVPAPEPSTWAALMIGGLLGYVGVTRKWSRLAAGAV